MTKGSNTWIWWTIGGVSLLGLGVGAYIFFKDRKEKRTNLMKETNAASLPSSTQGSSSSSASTSSASVTSDTPFKNEAEGNAFRNWVNDNYPDYARDIDLDRKGKFNNSTIKKAWKKYGSAYNNRNTNSTATPASSSMSLESIAASLADGGLVKDIKIESNNNRVRAFAYDGTGIGSNNIYVNLYTNGMLYFEDGKDEQKKSGTFIGVSPNMIIEVEGAKITGRGGIVVNQLAKALYPNASFGFDNNCNMDGMLYHSKVDFMDSNDGNL